jgi:hypothetical protein
VVSGCKTTRLEAPCRAKLSVPLESSPKTLGRSTADPAAWSVGKGIALAIQDETSRNVSEICWLLLPWYMCSGGMGGQCVYSRYSAALS